MKNYTVYLSVSASIAVDVDAETPEEAEEKALTMVDVKHSQVDLGDVIDVTEICENRK